MRSFGLKKLGVMAALGFAFLVTGSSIANAQTYRDYEREQRRIEREQRRVEREWRRDNRRNDGYNNRYSSNVVDQGYQQGLTAGQNDRRKGKYGRSNVYRNTGSYPNMGDPSSADYLYRQGYLQGYDDGYYGRYRN